MRSGSLPSRTRAVQLAFLALIAAAAAAHYALDGVRAARRPLFQNEYRNMGLNIAASGMMKEVSGPGPSARRMPLYPVFLSLVSAPGDRGLPAYGAQALLGVLSIVLAFAAAGSLSGPAAGLAAAAAVAFDPNIFGIFAATGVESLFAFAVLVAFNAVLRWGERPAARSAVYAGLGIGAALLCRSTLALLPPLLAAASFRLSSKLRKTAGLVLIFSFLPLLPWAARNAVLLKGFVPFENFSPVANFYEASLGKIAHDDPWAAVSDAERQSHRDLLSASDLEKSRAMTGLALTNIARNPFGYAWGSLRRLFGYWNYRLILFIPILVWLIRFRPGAAPALAFVFAASFSVHAFIALDAGTGERFLYPALPVLYCLAAASLWELAGLGARRSDARPAGFAGLLLACAAALTVLVAKTYRLMAEEVLVYGVHGAPNPGEEPQIADLEAEIRFFPREAKLYNDVGVLLFLENRGREAAGYLQTAVELDPRSEEFSKNLEAARRTEGPR